MDKRKVAKAVLSIGGVVGVVATGILSVKATPKALQLIEEAKEERGGGLSTVETVKATWKCYIPAFGVALGTIGCIAGSNILSHKQQASIIAAYSLLSKEASKHHKEYENKVKELFGQEAHERVLSCLPVEKTKDTCVSALSAYGLTNTCLDIPEDEDDKRLFYDEFSERYFESTTSKVLQAQYHLNRNFILRGFAPVNEFYEFLGLDDIRDGDALGWQVEDDLYWVDFDNQLTKLDDGLECCVIHMPWEPYIPDSQDYEQMG